MKIVKGNIIELFKDDNFDIIVHGCNCFCTMNAGIAKQLKKDFPEIEQMDNLTLAGDLTKLGKVTTIIVELNHGTGIIVNGYIQYKYGNDKVHVNYSALRNVFKYIKENYSGKRIAYPKIGAGLAGGDWTIISGIINQELDGEDHTLVILDH